VVQVRDEAPPFDPATVPSPDLSIPLEKRLFGGMGVFLMREMVDEIHHRIRPQGGNELSLVKRICGKTT
jgi:serine/threonine-protein kinase RsbW